MENLLKELKENMYYISDMDHIKDEDPEIWELYVDAIDKLGIVEENAVAVEAIVSPEDFSGSWVEWTKNMFQALNIDYVIIDGYTTSFVFNVNNLKKLLG